MILINNYYILYNDLTGRAKITGRKHPAARIFLIEGNEQTMAYELGILLGDRGNPYWQEQELWYRRYLPDFPFEAEMFFSYAPDDAEEQADLCSRLLRENIDALIVNPLDEFTLGRAVAGIRTRTLLIDAGPEINPAMAQNIPNYLPLKVCDYQEQGRLCAQFLAVQAPQLRRFCCIGGPQRSRLSTGRVSGALTVFGRSPDVEKRTVWSDFTRLGGYAAMEQMISWQPDAVFCANDLMALGALESLEAHGLKIPVGGVDLIPSAVYSVRNDGLAVTVGVNGSDVVTGLLRAADDYLTSGLRANGPLAASRTVTKASLREEHRRRSRFSRG